MPELLSAEQAAELLGIHRQTLANWRVSGAGPRFIKLGARVLYSPEEITTWLADNTRTSTSDRGAEAPCPNP